MFRPVPTPIRRTAPSYDSPDSTAEDPELGSSGAISTETVSERASVSRVSRRRRLGPATGVAGRRASNSFSSGSGDSVLGSGAPSSGARPVSSIHERIRAERSSVSAESSRIGSRVGTAVTVGLLRGETRRRGEGEAGPIVNDSVEGDLDLGLLMRSSRDLAPSDARGVS